MHVKTDYVYSSFCARSKGQNSYTKLLTFYLLILYNNELQNVTEAGLFQKFLKITNNTRIRWNCNTENDQGQAKQE